LDSRAWLQTFQAVTRNSSSDAVPFIAGKCGTGAANCLVAWKRGKLPRFMETLRGIQGRALVPDVALAFALATVAAHNQICLTTEMLPTFRNGPNKFVLVKA
jgi:hypothetical protein